MESSAEPVHLPAAGKRLEGRELEFFVRAFGPEKAEPDVYVLAFHGNAGRAEYTPDEVETLIGHLGHELRVEIWAMSYPGFGSDQQPATLRNLGEAALQGYAHLRQIAGERPVVVYGFSMGTTAALHIAANYAIEAPSSPAAPSALILDRSPNLGRIVMGHHGYYNLWLVATGVVLSLPGSARSPQNAAKVGEVPALFVLAEHDRLVRPQNAKSVVKRYAGPHRVVWIDGDHNTVADADGDSAQAEELRTGMNWLRSQWEAAPGS